jgi:hypothetical protein
VAAVCPESTHVWQPQLGACNSRRSTFTSGDTKVAVALNLLWLLLLLPLVLAVLPSGPPSNMMGNSRPSMSAGLERPVTGGDRDNMPYRRLG